jgi:DNA-binding FadR family transcriptional regulator
MAASPSAFGRVIETLGGSIVGGRTPAGATRSVQSVQDELGVSRSIVREAVRVLVSAGLLSAGRRVGLRVRPEAEWDTLHPLVIRLRLASDGRERQLGELRDLRLAVEPEAARLAAARRADAQAADLTRAATDLADASGDPARFLAADQRFHGLILTAAGNAMFLRLRAVIDETLRERASSHELHAADPTDVALHAAVADAIAHRAPDLAAEKMRALIERNERRR